LGQCLRDLSFARRPTGYLGVGSLLSNSARIFDLPSIEECVFHFLMANFVQRTRFRLLDNPPQINPPFPRQGTFRPLFLLPPQKGLVAWHDLSAFPTPFYTPFRKIPNSLLLRFFSWSLSLNIVSPAPNGYENPIGLMGLFCGPR